MKKNNNRKIDEESLTIVRSDWKRNRNLWIKFYHWRIRMWKIFNHKLVKVQKKVDNVD